MKIVYSWLREFLPGAPAPERLEEQLAGLGLETDAIIHIPAPHANVVFAQITSIEAIEGKQIRKCKVDIGEAESIQLITAAPNAYEGMGFALAKPGTILPGGMELGIRKFGDLESFGMGLSAKELGFGDFSAGLMDLPVGEVAPGTPLNTVWKEDWVLEVEITPNRPDWLSVFGVARDLSALGMPLVGTNPKPKTADLALPFSVKIDDAVACDRFTLSYAENIKIGPSPLLVQQRLCAAGMRPISNVVDATNYVMLELGNPMHAFDLRDIKEGIVVRRAKLGEKLTTLDAIEHELNPADLLITAKSGDQTIPEGLAGVMGGLGSEVKNDTSAIALEIAHFDPVSIRKTAKRHGYKTEASYRFERGVDTNGQIKAADRFLELLQQWSDGEVIVSSNRIDINTVATPASISFRPSYASRLIGMPVDSAKSLEILTRLGCEISGESEPFLVTPPSHRVDMQIEEDLIEETIRVLGYDQIPTTLPSFFPATDNLGMDAPFERIERIREIFVGLGFQEVINYSWTSPEECTATFAPNPTVSMANPQTPDRTFLRTALYPGLLQNLQQGIAYGEKGPYRLFEIGNVFTQTETTHLAALLDGKSVEGVWQKGLEGGFFALKGLLESSAKALGAVVKVEKEAFAHLHPGIAGSVWWNGTPVGSIGVLHPAIAEKLEIPQAVLLELSLPLPQGQKLFKDVAKFPASPRDLAVITKVGVTSAEIEKIIWAHASELLESVAIFDLYRGKPLLDDQKSMAFRMVFRHPERTLTDAETDAAFKAIIAAVELSGHAIRKS